MADGEEKLVLKPGGVACFLSSFERTADMESFQMTSVLLQNKKVESLAKTMDEVRETKKMDISRNNIVDVSSLKDM